MMDILKHPKGLASKPCLPLVAAEDGMADIVGTDTTLRRAIAGRRLNIARRRAQLLVSVPVQQIFRSMLYKGWLELDVGELSHLLRDLSEVSPLVPPLTTSTYSQSLSLRLHVSPSQCSQYRVHDRASMAHPFAAETSKAGRGTIHLALLPPETPRLRTVSYQYPLKLVSPAPIRTEEDGKHLIHTVYVLTYGGGLVAGDAIDLHVILDASTRLILLTQGSTKLFKSPSKNILSKQATTTTLAPGSALCYLPDPVQPFAKSNFDQHQIYSIISPESGASDAGSLCVLDWVSNGRPANGENWSFFRYGSRNEVFLQNHEGQRRLLLRDNLMLEDDTDNGSTWQRMDNLAVYGTLILHGPLMQSLGQFFMTEFKQLPRIGGRKWDSGSDDDEAESDPLSLRRNVRQRREAVGGVLWSAASLRGCVVVKLGAPTLEAARTWLHTMLVEERSIVRLFGERALLCLR